MAYICNSCNQHINEENVLSCPRCGSERLVLVVDSVNNADGTLTRSEIKARRADKKSFIIYASIFAAFVVVFGLLIGLWIYHRENSELSKKIDEMDAFYNDTLDDIISVEAYLNKANGFNKDDFSAIVAQLKKSAEDSYKNLYYYYSVKMLTEEISAACILAQYDIVEYKNGEAAFIPSIGGSNFDSLKTAIESKRKNDIENCLEDVLYTITSRKNDTDKRTAISAIVNELDLIISNGNDSELKTALSTLSQRLSGTDILKGTRLTEAFERAEDDIFAVIDKLSCADRLIKDISALRLTLVGFERDSEDLFIIIDNIIDGKRMLGDSKNELVRLISSYKTVVNSIFNDDTTSMEEKRAILLEKVGKLKNDVISLSQGSVVDSYNAIVDTLKDTYPDLSLGLKLQDKELICSVFEAIKDEGEYYTGNALSDLLRDTSNSLYDACSSIENTEFTDIIFDLCARLDEYALDAIDDNEYAYHNASVAIDDASKKLCEFADSYTSSLAVFEELVKTIDASIQTTLSGHTHMLSADAVTVEPTCSAQGYDAYICTYAGCTYKETFNLKPILPENHNFVFTSKAADCENDGYEMTACTYCGAVSGEKTVFNKKGHDYSIFVEIVYPTCTEGGYTLYKCSHCREAARLNEKQPEHSFAGGSCTMPDCDARDPDYEP